MIDDIEFAGISEELKEKMIEELGYDTVLNMACNYERVKENIQTFKSIGINNVDELIMYNSDLFQKKPDELKNKLTKFNIPEVVKLINEDYTTIDDILI